MPVTYEMRKNSGAWLPYVGSTVVASGEEWTVRKIITGDGAPVTLTSNTVTVSGAVVPDYIVTSRAEWDAAMSNSDATLSGKTIAISGDLGDRIVFNGTRTFSPKLTITSLDGASFARGVVFGTGVKDGVVFDGFTGKVVGWPAPHPMFEMIGSWHNAEIYNSHFLHGYGPSGLPIDTAYQYDEYTRVDNIVSATTTSTAHPITWMDTAMPSGSVYCFNNGAANIYYAVGGSDVVATTSSTMVAPGTYVRVSANPGTATHVAVLSASGTQSVNARCEIGMGQYLADFFTASGATEITNFRFIGNTVTDMRNGPKTQLRGGTHVFMDNTFRRIYMDVLAFGAWAEWDGIYFLRNIAEAQFCRSGIPQNLNGDAGDPHGDYLQLWTPATGGGGSLSNVYSAGNRMILPPLRVGAVNQGVLWSDSLTGGSGLYSISDTFLAGTPGHGIIISGQNSYFDDVYVHGATVFSPIEPSRNTRIKIETDTGNGYVGKSLARVFEFLNISGAPSVGRDNLIMPADPSALFEDLAGALTAETREEIETALATKGLAAGLGAVAMSDCVDWVTNDHTQVIKWATLPSGLNWPDDLNATINTMQTTALKKVLAGPANMTVVPEAGTEWRTTSDAAGTTVIQNWTTSSGVTNRGEYLQLRGMSSSSGSTMTSLGVSVNGHRAFTNIQTEAAEFFTTSSGGPAFVNPDPQGVQSALTVSANHRPTNGSIFGRIWACGSAAGHFSVSHVNGNARISLSDSAGTMILSNVTVTGVMTLNAWNATVFSFDLVEGFVRIWNNGELKYEHLFDPALYTGLVPNASNRRNGLLGTQASTQFYLGSVGSLKMWNESTADGSEPASTPFKTVQGDAATVNADSWKVGTDAT